MADEKTKTTQPVVETPAEPAAAGVAAAATDDPVVPPDATATDSHTAAAAAQPPADAPGDDVAGAILNEIQDLNAMAEAVSSQAPLLTPEVPAAAVPLAPRVSDELQRILRISVPVIVKLADKQLPLGDIMELSPGSIVEFTRSADTPLELMVNNKVIGRGVAVKVGEKFGLRIDEICSPQETIRKLGEP